MAHPLNRPRFDVAAGRVVDGLRRAAAARHAVAAGRPRRLAVPARLLQHERHRSLCHRRLRRVPGSVRRRLLHRQGHLRRRRVRSGARRPRAGHRHCSATICSRASSPAPGWPRTSRSSRSFPPATTSPRARQHRWARGDWQLLPWMFGRGRRGAIDVRSHSAIGRWKMLDNLRRTLSAPACVLALLAGLALPFAAASCGPASSWRRSCCRRCSRSSPPSCRAAPDHAAQPLGALGSDLWLALAQSALVVTFLAHQAWLMGDAIARTLVRLFVTRRNLLEWVTAAQATLGPRLDLARLLSRMAGSVALGGGAGGVVWLTPAAAPGRWPRPPACGSRRRRSRAGPVGLPRPPADARSAADAALRISRAGRGGSSRPS